MRFSSLDESLGIRGMTYSFYLLPTQLRLYGGCTRRHTSLSVQAGGYSTFCKVRPATAQVAIPMPGPSSTGTTFPYPYNPFFHCGKGQTVNIKVVQASMKRLANG